MKNIKLYIAALIICIGLFSCREDYLEVTPNDRLTDEGVWNTTDNADLFLNDIYEKLPNMNNETEHLDQYTDNSDVGVQWMTGYSSIRTANVSSENVPRGGWDIWKWETAYGRIRACNLFIQKVSESDLPDDYKTKRIAEARFLRALYYHWIWMAYGGVPVITDVLDNNSQGNDIFQPRSTDSETFAFIVRELNEIKDSLPTTPDGADYGRATKGAALTLKGWCELFYASPLKNPNGDVKRWQVAATTNKQVMGLGVYGLVDDYRNLFLEANNNSIESIFARQYGPGKGGQLEGKLGVTFIDGTQQSWGNFQPTQELVDEYSMSNGLAINEPGSGYDPQNPYANREKRFYQSIVYDGSVFQNDTIYTRKGVNSKNEIDLGYTSDVTHTGYYARKRLDESIVGSDNRSNSTSYQNYMIFRYAEVLLNFAEAENEVNGPTAEVKAAVDAVRTRGGNLPSIDATYSTVDQDLMREIIHRERRVELAFEDKRWWDILRLKIAITMPDGSPGVLNRPLVGMVIEENGGNLTYTKTNVSNRLFLEKMYLMPIPQSALDRNSAIRAQNGGPDNWVNGQNPGY
ncbi:MAG: RagB/SusD family nutrient uptake outer membrane protein [Cyclobacteriaceae bacterium]|nr:RagB/SusD family nutrient uptake outer membrane protein [Cyclobacteriaceae bacterium]